MRRTLPLIAFLALVLISAAAFGQAQKGSVTVTVTDEQGGVLPGATVTAESDQTLTNRTGVTNEAGIARLVALDPAANYVVTTAMDGFNGARNENVLVRAGQDVPINVSLSLATVTEEMIVTAESPVVDITSAAAGQEITLELTEALPTARSYQDYLQLVPGVQATTSGNPASRSGMNYSDIGGAINNSTDNFYYFEGINVTDGMTGTFGANMNTEIIQEQSVQTGALDAQFIGATGLVSNVITKSGGNEFSGSVNYYTQNDSLVEDNEHRQAAAFSTFDTAFTLGGPIARDKAWFFASYRLVEDERDVADPDDTNLVQRSVTREDNQAFAKLTWAPTQSDLLSGIFLSDPMERDGSFTTTTTNNRDSTREQGGDRYTLGYSRVWGPAVIDLGFSQHDGDLDTAASNPEIRNDVSFRNDDPHSAADEQLGGQGFTTLRTRSTDSFRASVEFLASTGFGDHTIRAGFDFASNEAFTNSLTNGGAEYTSLSNRYVGTGVRVNEIEGYNLVEFSGTASDLNGLRATIDGLPNAGAYYAAYDTDHDGYISDSEFGQNMLFNDTTSNPNGQINYARTLQVQDGPSLLKSEGTTYYVQDNWQMNRWSVNLGLRVEEWDHFADTGDNIMQFETEYAPRFSIAYDLKGDGKQRVSAYYGRYYDPIRNNMTSFAGSLVGAVRHEQVWGLGEWLTYRVRGGTSTQDAFFAPTTQTPYTDEYQIGYKIDLGSNMSFETNLIKRETRDILEDYDMHVYADEAGYGLPVDHPDSLYLGLGYFGYDSIPPSNFIIATLAGGERNWEGLELVFRKRMSNNWQMLASYNYADGEGNTNSDSNADFQGDVLWLDPRAINQTGTQPGLVEHLAKVAGTYQWDNGLSVGLTGRYQSGAIGSRTWLIYRRHLPLWDVQDDTYNEEISFAGGDGFGGAGGTGYWLSPNAVGTYQHPSSVLFDLRLSYLWRIGDRMEADFFFDVFNVADEQKAIATQDLVGGSGGINYGEGVSFNSPRRYYLGARLRF